MQLGLCAQVLPHDSRTSTTACKFAAIAAGSQTSPICVSTVLQGLPLQAETETAKQRAARMRTLSRLARTYRCAPCCEPKRKVSPNCQMNPELPTLVLLLPLLALAAPTIGTKIPASGIKRNPSPTLKT